MSGTTPGPREKGSAALVIFAKAPIPGQVKTRLCPALTEDEAATLHGSFVLDQQGEDLGPRMQQAFDSLFSRGYRQVCLVGTDVPSLPLTHYRDAIGSLAQHDLVIGPARDGGYYLIGLTKPCPALFTAIPWSTD